MPTDHTYTGQRSEDFGLMDYNARYFSPVTGKFISADTLIPQPGNLLAWDRYGYAYNNPVINSDPSGHFVIPTGVVVAIVVVSKVIDYGWTAYDAGSSIIIALDSNKSSEIRKDALQSAILAVGMELIEPDESTIGLPLDDIIRHSGDLKEVLIRVIPSDQIGTSQGFKLRKGEDGLSVFEGLLPEDVLSELPGIRVPNTTVEIPKNLLPNGTQVRPTTAESLSQMLSDAHRILIPPEGWSINRFAKKLKEIVGWK